MKKKVLSLLMATAMVVSMVACGNTEGSGAAGTTDNNSTAATEDAGASTDDVKITILNSKVEVQTQFEEMAEAYKESTGVEVEVYCADTDTTVASQLSTRYASNDPYTIAMVDPKDVYSLAADYATDLSNEEWVSHTNLAITVDGKVAGFPTCVEARGIIYNADAIESITGETFNPTDYATLDSFTALLDRLVAGGMEKPVAILSEYWSLGAHYAAEIYEQQADPDAFVNGLLAGSEDMASNAKFNSMMDTFDTLIKYNYAKGSAANADREESSMKLAEGEVAFMFGGNWDWSVLNQYDYTENMGIMPVPQNMEDGMNTKLCGGGSKYFIVDSTDNTSEAQRQAAKDFLNWIVFEADGNAFLTEQCLLVPAFDNIDASALDPLSSSVKAYADGNNLIANYNYLPDDHMTVVGQELMQKYLDEKMTRDELAQAMVDYFKGATPIAH
ncbi:MAG: carbohydrate ABC transporter substrate-binding protein [Pseudobutyrivibrio sp.]|nr:carbohydrate ABC transporter substrate-binding protein [Pseudobutyrivibrio sp.]